MTSNEDGAWPNHRRETDGHCGGCCGSSNGGGGGGPAMRKLKTTSSMIPETTDRRRPPTSATCANGAADPARWQTSGSPTAGAGLNAASVTRPMATVPSWHVPVERGNKWKEKVKKGLKSKDA